MTSLVAILIVFSLDDPKADQAKKLIAEEARNLQGSWRVVKTIPAARKVKEDYRVVFKDGKVTFGDRPPYKFRIDPSKNPKWIDIDIAPLFGQNKKEKYAPGIYQLDRDKLILAIINEADEDGFKPRPKNFKDKFHGGLIYLERVK